jgi:hypothetical protein
MNEWQKAGSGLAASNDGYWVNPTALASSNSRMIAPWSMARQTTLALSVLTYLSGYGGVRLRHLFLYSPTLD